MALGTERAHLHSRAQHVRAHSGFLARRHVERLVGETPSYHAPVFVLTHHARAPIVMDGGTTFYYVTDGIHAAFEPAIDAAGGKDVRLGGGVATIRQCLAAGLIDEMHLAISPVLLGSGEHLLAGIDAAALGYPCAEYVSGEQSTHVVLAKQKRG